MRHIQVTHTYVLEVPPDTETVDIQNGIHIMEQFMRQRSSKMQEIKSSWAWMPREYRAPAADPRSEAPIHGFSSTTNEGVTHPWDQGLWIFPEDHPLRSVEAVVRENYMNPHEHGVVKDSLKLKMLQLEAGDDDATALGLEEAWGDDDESSV